MEVALGFFGVILACFTIILTRWIICRRNIHRSLKKYGIPGPKPDFIAGNMYQLQKEPNPNDIIEDWLKKYGDVFGYFMGEDIYVVIKDLEMLKKVLIKDFSVFSNKPTFLLQTDPFPKMLIGLRDKRWKEVRNVLTPAFSSGKIKFMTDVVSKKVDLFVDLVMKKANNKEIINIHELGQGLTLDVISACALAVKKNIQENPKDDILQAVRDTFKHQFNPIEELGILFPFLSKILHLFDDLFIFKKSLNTIADHLKVVMKERRQNPNLRSLDILQSILDSCDSVSDGNGTKLTEEEAIANALVVLLAGYNTTANSLGFTFFLLATHPEIQDRLYQEIRQARDTSYSTLQNMTYLDQVYSESLRVYPPVTGFIHRKCDRDYDLGPYTIPKGANIIAPVWNIHHDPNLWPDPNKFDPDRFSPTNKGSIQSMSYFPFGAGPRNCIGSRFAQLEAKIAIYRILQKVKLEPCEKTDNPLSLVCAAFTILPVNGVWLKATPRNPC
ncbi:cytochrome P450 3A16 [Parasteatoda tepidariorum]|uniref:cytochrome P450 3A16 n=1 Tax=Parasteatoda tepidariorum TaxID=114398 RepID=UPI001C7289BA|nr:cytochrome P450 3A16 [Parasteatoda tepidariorum]XP_042905398.1 cytochrome P450 3A16 [Parasteatoda tepidariorum]XP_042905399.1 cytochrome P450 3A16 [Parasteatoda tepidariorum]XP_042905400.1 cytochrome P450 3A16 [Parasteatoda tepidariorum]